MHTLVSAQSSFFLMVDLQERLLPAISNREAVVRSSAKLLTAARELSVPLVVTEQYPRGIGPTVPQLAELIPAGTPNLTKTSFSCCGAAGFDAVVTALGRNTAVIFGTETHICVLATAMDLVGRGVKVVLAADACGSREGTNHELALAAARSFGALVVPAETVIYQMMGEAGTPHFKALLPILK